MQCKRHKFTVSAIYSPPRHNIKQDEYIKFLQTLGNFFIVGGDFNAKYTHWCSRYTSVKGKELLHVGKSLDCMFPSSGSPSYWPTDVNRHPDVIDFFIIRDLSINYIKVESSTDLSSDHTLVVLTLMPVSTNFGLNCGLMKLRLNLTLSLMLIGFYEHPV